MVDFEHVVPRDHILERGAFLFRKEFYDTGICSGGGTHHQEEKSLKAFAREWIEVVEPGEEEEEEQWMERVKCRRRDEK